MARGTRDEGRDESLRSKAASCRDGREILGTKAIFAAMKIYQGLSGQNCNLMFEGLKQVHGFIVNLSEVIRPYQTLSAAKLLFT